MQKKKWLTATLSTVMALSLAAGCTTTGKDTESSPSPVATAGGSESPSASVKGAVINTYINGEIPTLDPGLAKSTSSSWPLDHMFEGLYFQDKDGLVPGQAKDVKVSDDGLTYTFTLKDDLKWSNGDPVTAGDFEFAWKRVLDPNFPSEYAYQIADYVKGATEYNTAKPSEISADELAKLRDAVGVKATDEKTLVVELVNPTPFFNQLVSFYTYYPVNQKVVEADENWANEAATLVTNGPFTVKEWGKDTKLVVVKNENYYDKDKITATQITWNNITDDNTAWQMYSSGELNVYQSVTPAAVDTAKKNEELIVSPQLATYFYRFNVTKEPLNNAKVRKALAMAIDRQAIVDTITRTGQTPAYALVSPGIIMNGKDYRTGDAASEKYFEENVEEAKKLLAEGLAELKLSSFPKVELTYNTNEAHKKIAEAIQEMWKKNLGVEVELGNVESKVWLDRTSNLDYQIMRTGWVGDYLDPMTFVDMFVTGGGNNNTGWSNARYDELVAEAKKEQDEAKRIAQFREAEEILMDEMPIMPIYFYVSADALKKEIKGVYRPANRERIFRYATME